MSLLNWLIKEIGEDEWPDCYDTAIVGSDKRLYLRDSHDDKVLLGYSGMPDEYKGQIVKRDQWRYAITYPESMHTSLCELIHSEFGGWPKGMRKVDYCVILDGGVMAVVTVHRAESDISIRRSTDNIIAGDVTECSVTASEYAIYAGVSK